MCGIVGYIGDKECAYMLLDGLKRLEYRGYDSAGIAVHDGEKINIVRIQGKLINLEKAIREREPKGKLGIGHTRWATHGRPSETNAHPHYADGVAVVHNGIVENHLLLRKRLKEEGVEFQSETDTEIFAHLIAKYLRKMEDPFEAVRKTLEEVQGSYALGIIFDKYPELLIAAKNSSPLIIGIGEGENYIASDIPAILPYTNKIVPLDEGEMAIITKEGFKIETIGGNAVYRAPKIITWSPVQAEKGGYKHFMLKEIHEQPRAVEDTLRGRVSLERADINPELIGLDEKDAEFFQRVVLVGCGTSYHAALTGKYWLESLARIPVEVEIASEYRARKPLVTERDLVIGVSQSGETIDTLEALKSAKKGGARILAIANVVDSAIPRISHGALYTHAGPEIGVASTKCFTAQLAALLMLAIYFGKRRKVLEDEGIRILLQELLEVPNKIRTILNQKDYIQEIALKYVHSTNFLYLGRGISYPIALEGALKLKEISYIHAEGYPAGEMKHGPIALIDENMPVVLVMPKDQNYERIIGNLQEVKARQGKTIIVTNTESVIPDELVDDIIRVPVSLPELSPFLTVIPLQLIAYYIADFKGTDVDQPRNLAKTVTVE